MVRASAELLEVEALFEGPPVTTCFQCDRTLPISSTRWHGERSDQGQLVALFPYCETCLRNNLRSRREHR
jgi:hypothetical protein